MVCVQLKGKEDGWDGEGTDLALQHAQAALEDVHDRVVDALPVVDGAVVMDASHEIDRTVVFAACPDAFRALLLSVPTLASGKVLLG